MAFTVLLLSRDRQKTANLVKERNKDQKAFSLFGCCQDRRCCQETLRTFGVDSKWKVWEVFGKGGGE